jgi:hypothetical protein
MHSKVSHPGCLVCGYPSFQSFDEYGLSTFEICPSCGLQSGYDYSESSQETDLLRLRRSWLTDRNAIWSSSMPPPDGWDAYKQISKAGLTI